MTPEKRAHHIRQELCLRGDTVEIEVEFIADQIREAITSETDRCARIAENCEVTLDGDDPFGNLQIASAIRAQTLPEPKMRQDPVWDALRRRHT